jgi:hypothetical protein
MKEHVIMPNYYNSEGITSVEEFITHIFDYARDNPHELWYRGHRSQDWKLRPSLFREEVLDMPDDGAVHLIKYKNFMDFNVALKQFRDELREIIKDERLNLFHYTFLAQHYGMPTPALDWSTDPLIALYFAVDGFEYTNEDEFPVVYILNPTRVNENSPMHYIDENPTISEVFCVDDADDKLFENCYSDMNNTPFATIPFAVKSDYDLKSQRISRQSGVFTLHEARYYKGVEWIDFVTADREKMGVALKISPSSVEFIKNQLKILNLTPETIYGQELTILEEKAKSISTEAPKI